MYDLEKDDYTDHDVSISRNMIDNMVQCQVLLLIKQILALRYISKEWLIQTISMT